MKENNEEEDLKDILTPSDKFSDGIYGNTKNKEPSGNTKVDNYDKSHYPNIPSWVDPIVKVIGIITVALLLLKFGINVSAR